MKTETRQLITDAMHALVTYATHLKEGGTGASNTKLSKALDDLIDAVMALNKEKSYLAKAISRVAKEMYYTTQDNTGCPYARYLEFFEEVHEYFS